MKPARNAVGRKLERRKIVRETALGLTYEYYAIGRHVVIAPGICSGKPTFKRTRIEVRTILDWIREGRTVQDVLKSYPSLTRSAIEEAIDLAGKALANQFALKAG
jgi:uncharacterized protein (DUF433 family)